MLKHHIFIFLLFVAINVNAFVQEIGPGVFVHIGKHLDIDDGYDGDICNIGFIESVLTTASRETLRAQAAWLRKNSSINIVLEGHADERGTREYNLALGERRANSAKDYLMTYGISSDRISVLSYGKERPVDAGSNPLAWSKNRRSVTVKAN